MNIPDRMKNILHRHCELSPEWHTHNAMTYPFPVRIWQPHPGSFPPPRLRSSGEVRELLASMHDAPAIHLFPRADGPGSSLDLPPFIATAYRHPREIDPGDPAWHWSSVSMRTIGACIDAPPIIFRALPADDPSTCEYFAPDFHREPLRTRGFVTAQPRFFVNNILHMFRLEGIRLEASPMPAIYRGTGLGGSNLAHLAALTLASLLIGAGLNRAQLFSGATYLETFFGLTEDSDASGVSMTGGQESLAALQGGIWDNVPLPFTLGPFSSISRELVSPVRYPELERHLLIVNPGIRRKEGVTSSGVNRQWLKRWLDEEGARLHHGKIPVAYRAAEALRLGNYDDYADTIREYRSIRGTLAPSYLHGQEELAAVCKETDAEFFPLGAGTGSSLVCATDPSAIEHLRQHFSKEAGKPNGRGTLPFRIREQGIEWHLPETGDWHPPAAEV